MLIKVSEAPKTGVFYAINKGDNSDDSTYMHTLRYTDGILFELYLNEYNEILHATSHPSTFVGYEYFIFDNRS